LVGLAEMGDGEVEEAFLEKVLLDAEHDSGEVAFAEFGSDDADGVGEAGAQHAGVQVGAVIKFLGGGVNTLLGGGGDRGCDGGVIEDDGDGGGRQIKILGEHFEGGGSSGFGGLLFSCHRAPADGCSTYGNSCTPFGGNCARSVI
jgi:hypothetical protein